MAVGWIPQAEYDAMTLSQLQAILTEVNRQRRKPA